MNRRAVKFLVIGGVLVFVLLGGLFIGYSPSEGPGIDNVSTSFSLATPAFAQGIPSGQFPMNEAGISAYVNTEQALDLSKVKSLYKVLEDETENYLIGTVELSGYGEEWWPHVWIQKSGWILVYYTKNEPTSRLMKWDVIQWDQPGFTTTTLREVLVSVARRLGVDMARVESGLRYYHWQYPEATRMLVVLDTTNAGADSFQYTIPSELTIYDLSASHRGEVGSNAYGSCYSATNLDEVKLLGGGQGTYVLVGQVPEKYLLPQAPHVVALGHKGGWTGIALFFLYR